MSSSEIKNERVSMASIQSQAEAMVCAHDSISIKGEDKKWSPENNMPGAVASALSVSF